MHNLPFKLILRLAAILILAIFAIVNIYRASAGFWNQRSINNSIASWNELHAKPEPTAPAPEANVPPPNPAETPAVKPPAEGEKPKGKGKGKKGKKDSPEKKEPKSDDRYAEIKKAGLIGPPQMEAPMMLSAIIDNTAIINGQPMQVGEMINGNAKLLEIHSNKVVVEKDGNKMDLVLFNN